MRAGVCVVRATARPAPAEGGGGLREWVTSRSRRQAVWAAEPMNQLSGGGSAARRAGGGCRNAPGAARPGRARDVSARLVAPRRPEVPASQARPCRCPPRPVRGCARVPSFPPVTPTGARSAGRPTSWGGRWGGVREDIFTYCDCGTYLKGNIQ